MATCGEQLVRLLEAYGVEFAFGIPGVHTVELYRGLSASGIRHVTPRHEQGAGFMADGYARVSGKPGVCFVVTGPGMTNIMTAMGQAYADSVPMLVVSSVNRTEQLGMGEGRLHELPSQSRIVSGVSAFSHTLLHPDQLSQVMARAFAIFSGSRPRPVHIEIPIDLIARQAIGSVVGLRAIPKRPGPRPQEVERAARLLFEVKKPIVILGGGAVDAAALVRSLAEDLDAPVINTINAKGLLPPGHPLRAGENMAFEPIRQAIAAADVVLAVGTEFGETEMYPQPKDVQITGALIRIDIDPEQLVRKPAADLPIVSDAGLALEAISAGVAIMRKSDVKTIQTGSVGIDSPGARRATAIRTETTKHWWPAVLLHQKIAGLACEALPDAILVGDQTEPIYALNQCFEPMRPRSYFNSSTGYGTLGYALPAGIGAKLAAPDRPVVVLAGDGGLQFSIGEMASAIEAKTPLVLLLWNNEGYGEIKTYMQERAITPIGVDIFTPDFVAIARGFGWRASQPRSFVELAEALKVAACTTLPTLIELRADAPFLQY